MKSVASISLAAVLCFAFAGPAIASANNSAASDSNAPGSASASSANAMAMQMVRARVALLKDIDARKIKADGKFQARLADKVHLKNGKELPSGTVLIGTVTADKMTDSGTSRLAINFAQAKLKDGTIIPVHATIVGVAAPESMSNEGFNVAPGDQMSNTWDSSVLQVDQINALSGVDLHSKIAGDNSGVFVSNKKHDMKLDQGTEFALALGAAI